MTITVEHPIAGALRRFGRGEALPGANNPDYGPWDTYTAGPDTTGVIPGITRRTHQGDLEVTTPGAVIENLDILGRLVPRVPCTITNVRVLGPASAPFPPGGTANYALIPCWTPGLSGVVMRNVTIEPRFRNVDIYGLHGFGFEAYNFDISGVVDGMVPYGGTVHIQQPWIHDIPHYDIDPRQTGGSHDDDIQAPGGLSLSIYGGRLDGGSTCCLLVGQNTGPNTKVDLRRIWMRPGDGGSVPLQFSENGRGAHRGVSIRALTFEHNPAAAFPATLVRMPPATYAAAVFPQTGPDASVWHRPGHETHGQPIAHTSPTVVTQGVI